jgi:hypothetical protein
MVPKFERLVRARIMNEIIVSKPIWIGIPHLPVISLMQVIETEAIYKDNDKKEEVVNQIRNTNG